MKKRKPTSEATYHPQAKRPTIRNFFSRKKIPQDIIGNIAILKFKKRTLKITKYLKARKFLKQHKNITTVVEKTEKISGKLRTHKTKHLYGIKTKIATYKENDCIFKFNIDESYFSPRLSNERKIISEEVSNLLVLQAKRPTSEATHKRSDPQAKRPTKMCNILVMFAGIAPYPIIISKELKSQKKNFHIFSNELNKNANKEAQKNITLNKLQNYITLIPGDAKTLPSQLTKTAKSTHTPTHPHTHIPDKFDIILMPRPNLKETFLKTALKLSKKNTIIFYHGFGTKEKVIEEIKKDTKNKIRKIKIRKAGDIGPHLYRWQAEFKVK